jgi:hypothetical protein
MSRPSIVGAGFLVASIAASRPCAAQQDYRSPVAGLTLPYGARTGWGGPDALIVGGGGFAGWRWTQWRGGVLGRALWWRPDPGVAVDAGAFVSLDLLSVWADSALSAAAFVRVEPAVRWVSSTTRWAFLPGAGIGVRLVGFDLSVGLTPEIGLGSYVRASDRFGFGADWRLGVDLVELVRLLDGVRASGAPLPQ